jgi:hypothetical protein
MNTTLKTYAVVSAIVATVVCLLTILYASGGAGPVTPPASAAGPAVKNGAAPAKDPPTAAPATARAATAPTRPTATPRPLPATAPVAKAPAGPQDYVEQAEDYGAEIGATGKVLGGKWKIGANGELEPAVKITVTNRGQRNVNHLKMVCQLDAGLVYQDTQTVTPLAGPGGARKVLARDGGTVEFTVPFKKVVVTEASQTILRAHGAAWKFEVTEVGFAD